MNRRSWVSWTRGLCAVLVVAGCASPGPPKPAAVKAAARQGELAIPDDLKELIRKSSAVGRQLYVLDKVAAIGTDVMLENVPDPRASGVRGYIPIQDGDEAGRPKDSFLVSFFNADDPPRIVCEVRVAPGKKPSFQAFDPPKESTSSFVDLVRARQLAIASMPPPTQPINPVLLPGEPGEVVVYLLAGTKKPGVAVFGRHFRAVVPLGAKSVSAMQPLSNSALEVAMRVPDGAEPVALTVSQVVTDYPLETHVFTSLLTKMTVFVGTRRGVWRVDGDKIALIEAKAPGR
jgi:hypothetical protein